MSNKHAPLLMTTTDTIPGVSTYQVLGIVTAHEGGTSNGNEKALAALEKEAVKLGATAVIGIQMSTYRPAQLMAGTFTDLIGTAIRW